MTQLTSDKINVHFGDAAVPCRYSACYISLREEANEVGIYKMNGNWDVYRLVKATRSSVVTGPYLRTDWRS